MFEFADVFPGSLTWLYGSHYLGGNFIRTNNKVGGNRWDSVANYALEIYRRDVCVGRINRQIRV